MHVHLHIHLCRLNDAARVAEAQFGKAYLPWQVTSRVEKKLDLEWRLKLE